MFKKNETFGTKEMSIANIAQSPAAAAIRKQDGEKNVNTE